MARPLKEGLDYFPFDVDFYEDLKIEDLSNEFGPLGESVYKRVLCLIYRDKGYYLEVDKAKLAVKLIKSIGNRWVRSKEQVIQVILYCAEIGLFDKDLLLRGVITSVGIQKRYLKAKGRRPQINTSYWLLDKNGEEPYINSPKMGVLEEKTGVCYPKTSINTPISTQRKEKKSKVNKSKEQQQEVSSGCGNFSPCIELFENIKGAPLSQYESDKVIDLVKTFGSEWVSEALQIMADAGKCKLNYAEGILKNWQANGKDKFKQQKPKRKGPEVMASNTDYSQIFNR